MPTTSAPTAFAFVWMPHTLSNTPEVFKWIENLLRDYCVIVYVARDILDHYSYDAIPASAFNDLIRGIKLEPYTGSLQVMTHRDVYGPRIQDPKKIVRACCEHLHIHRVFIATEVNKVAELAIKISEIDTVQPIGF